MGTNQVAMPELPKIPGANMIQFPALLPGMPAPPAIPALPGMEKIPPPPGVTVLDAEGKVIAKGPELPKMPAIPGLPPVAGPPIPEELPKEKLGEEEIEKLLAGEVLAAPTRIEEEILEETEGAVEAAPSAAAVSGIELEEEVEEVETRIEEAELTGEELVI